MLLAGAFALLAGGCGEERSYMVVKVRAQEGEYTGLTQFKVYVSRDLDRSTLFFPSSMAGPFKISTTEAIDFSVSFPTRYTGTLKVGVEPLGSNSVPVGYGEAQQGIDPGEVSEMDVAVVRDARAPSESGAMCQPTKANTCGTGKACYLGCNGTTAIGICESSSGVKKVGEACANNSECVSGSQCLAFPCGKICMQFCETNTDCPGRDCYTDIPCGANSKTGVRICSQTCDPRASQMMNGCQAGFACLIFPREVVSCDCPQTRPRGDDGMECTSFADCKPGLVCVGMGGPRPVCRPLCKRSDNDCAGGRICTEIQDPEMNTTYATWGACITPPAP